MHTSAIIASMPKLAPSNIRACIDKDTDILLLVRLLRTLNIEFNQKTLYFLNILFGAYYKNLLILEDIVKEIPIYHLEIIYEIELWKYKIYDLIPSEVTNAVDQAIHKRFREIKDELSFLNFSNTAFVLFEFMWKITSMFKEYKPTLQNLLNDNVLLLANRDTVQNSIAFKYNINLTKIFEKELFGAKVNKEFLDSIGLDSNKYPMTSKLGFLIYLDFAIEKIGTKLFFRPLVSPIKEFNNTSDFVREKREIGCILQQRLNQKFEYKFEYTIIGTEEEILEELKKRFPKKEVQA
jgi:hypothetical protein